MRAIAAVSSDWGIGKNNDLLFHIPEDLHFFHRMTNGHTMVLGRKNLESFPGAKPLPGRHHLVWTHNPDYHPEGVQTFHTLPELKNLISQMDPNHVWVCGGGMVYEELLPYCTEALITEIDACPDADVFFPDLSQTECWELAHTDEWQQDDSHRYRFCTWINRSVLPLPDSV